MIELVDNRYGKCRVRVMKVSRHGLHNDIYEWTVAVLLRGEFAKAHSAGDNSMILATDTMKNTIYWMARQSGAATPEAYACELIDYLLGRNPQVASAEVRIESHTWKRLTVDGAPHPDTFMHGSGEAQTARVERSQSAAFAIRAGLSGMHLLKTAHSAFSGFIRDSLTSLPETEDRVFGTVVDAEWHYSSHPKDYAAVHRLARETLLRTFANHHSASVQHTLYAMAEDVFAAVAEIDEMRITMPNKHCLLIDLERFGGDNPNQIFIPTDEPHGYIEACLRRKA